MLGAHIDTHIDIDKTPSNDWNKGFSLLTDGTTVAVSLKLRTPENLSETVATRLSMMIFPQMCHSKAVTHNIHAVLN